MAADNGGGPVSPAVVQWAFISILVMLFGLSRTGGALGTARQILFLAALYHGATAPLPLLEAGGS